MKPTAHRWRLSRRPIGNRQGLFFGCPCGFSVLQAPVGETYPEAFVRAVNEHLRAIDLDGQPHLQLVTGAAQ